VAMPTPCLYLDMASSEGTLLQRQAQGLGISIGIRRDGVIGDRGGDKAWVSCLVGGLGG
jgi:hypothetical protein